MKKIILIFAILFMSNIANAADYQILHPVNDYAGVLSKKTVDSLNFDLQQYRKNSTNQIAVLIIPDMAGSDIESYSIRVATKWKGGIKGKDNAVLIVIAVKERKWRIEVGKGFEGNLTDSIAGRIGRDTMVPYLKKGDWDSAVISGVFNIKKAIK